MQDENVVISGYASAAEIAAGKDTPTEQAQTETPNAEQPAQQPQQAETAQVEKPAEVQQPTQQPAQQPADAWSGVTPESFATRYKDKRKDVLKAFGVNDFMVDALDYYDRTGSLAEYAEVKSVDYNKLSDDDIIRRGLRQEYAHLDLSPEDWEMLYENRVTNRFKTDADAFSEKEVKAGKLELKLEADKLRRQYIENQKKFVAPEIQKQEQPDLLMQMQEMQQYMAAVPEVKQFMSDKKLVLGSGDRTYNYEINNPQVLLDVMTSGEVYQRHLMLRDEKGNPVLDTKGNPVVNYKKLMKAAAIILDDATYDKLLISHGISLGAKGIIDSVEHPETNKQGGTGEPATLWQAMKNAKVS
jgi:hypothetical protein